MAMFVFQWISEENRILLVNFTPIFSITLLEPEIEETP